MVKQTKITLRTRHINCFYCIAISIFILSIVLFALSSEQAKVFGDQQNRIPVIITASILLVLSIIIIIWITYYAIGYCRLKKHEQVNRFKQPQQTQNSIPSRPTTATSVVIFDNAVFTMDDPLAVDTLTNIEASV